MQGCPLAEQAFQADQQQVERSSLEAAVAPVEPTFLPISTPLALQPGLAQNLLEVPVTHVRTDLATCTVTPSAPSRGLGPTPGLWDGLGLREHEAASHGGLLLVTVRWREARSRLTASKGGKLRIRKTPSTAALAAK